MLQKPGTGANQCTHTSRAKICSLGEEMGAGPPIFSACLTLTSLDINIAPTSEKNSTTGMPGFRGIYDYVGTGRTSHSRRASNSPVHQGQQAQLRLRTIGTNISDESTEGGGDDPTFDISSTFDSPRSTSQHLNLSDYIVRHRSTLMSPTQTPLRVRE
jgi:hypothetical protein